MHRQEKKPPAAPVEIVAGNSTIALEWEDVNAETVDRIATEIASDGLTEVGVRVSLVRQAAEEGWLELWGFSGRLQEATRIKMTIDGRTFESVFDAITAQIDCGTDPALYGRSLALAYQAIATSFPSEAWELCAQKLSKHLDRHDISASHKSILASIKRATSTSPLEGTLREKPDASAIAREFLLSRSEEEVKRPGCGLG